MKKKSVSRNILTFFGVGLILLGVVWTCLQLSQPDELNAAPGPVRVMQRGNTKQTTPPPDPATQDEETLFPTLDSEPAPLLLSASPLDEADSAVFPDEPVFEPDTPISELPAAEPAAPIAVAPNTSPVLSPTPRPGSVDMEGPQTAQLIVIKEIPEEVSFQTESFYRVHVKNAGNTVARGVVIRDAVPEGARFVSSEPQTAQLLGSELTWPPFDMKPNEERVFECRFIPEQEGVIGSTATVTFATEASGKNDLYPSATSPGGQCPFARDNRRIDKIQYQNQKHRNGNRQGGNTFGKGSRRAHPSERADAQQCVG